MTTFSCVHVIARECNLCYLRVNRYRIRFCNKNNLGGLKMIASTNRSDMGGWGRVSQYKIPKWIWPYAAILAQQTGKRSTRAAAWPNPKSGPPRHSTAKLSAHVAAAPLTCASGCWQMISGFGSATYGQHGASASSYPNPSTGPTYRRTRSAFGSLTIGALDIITSRVGEFYYRQQNIREGHDHGVRAYRALKPQARRLYGYPAEEPALG